MCLRADVTKVTFVNTRVTLSFSHPIPGNFAPARYRQVNILSSAPSTAVATAVPNKRKETRINVALRVKVATQETMTDGIMACTYDVSAIGARITGINTKFQIGQVLWVQRNTKRARYTVHWIGEKGTPQQGQLGLALLPNETVIWDAELKPRLT